MPRAGRAFGWLVALGIVASHGTAHAMVRCTIESVSGVPFGAYRTNSDAPLDSVGSLSFRCEGVMAGDSISIRLNKGHGGGTYNPRSMKQGKARLEYNLYLDAARTIIWGDGTNGTSTYTAAPVDGQLVSIPIYGRVPPRQNVSAGNYGDTIVVQLLF